jgi:hypothetical protein
MEPHWTEPPNHVIEIGAGVAEIVDELRRGPLLSVDDAESVAGAPAAPGFYAWWAVPDAIPGVPLIPHPSEPLGLLYVGIAPRNAASSTDVRRRLCGQHIGGNVGSSTFRFGLASLLWEREGWTPRASRSGRPMLAAEDNRALSAWQRGHLRVRWAVVQAPWRFEADVIATMTPPMNREGNSRHPFYAAMGEARSAFRAAAQAR